MLSAPFAAQATSAVRSTFGHLPDGRAVEAVTLDNGHGITARVLAYGARLQSLRTPDRHGHEADIVLGHPHMKGYLDTPQYFGATVGRYANRIAKGRFTLDGHTYQVPVNDGPNSLHGGTKGFDKVLWTVVGVEHDADHASVTLRYVSPDGDMGYPGTLTVTAIYSLDTKNRLTIDYRATTDKPTIVNLSNHAYWNLGGEGSGTVMNQRMMIAADTYLPVDATAIPTGQFAPVAGTPFDFRSAKPIGRDIRDGASQQLLYGHGYDHNWVISRHASAKPRLIARVSDPDSGRVLSLYSCQPGLQFYSGNFLDGTTQGPSGRTYRQGDAFVLEPQLFPDTPNQPAFGSARLAPGQTYRNHIVYRFSTQGGH
ncbi:aldose epimerase family protein [Oleiagrimonas soli]|nr:aldose epimerase family protein [Oleiagrimonas soli]MBB6184515.1 aldose 1-epimerase [Oleiagrimonas soli]